MNPKVFKSFIKSPGPIPRDAEAIEGSLKYLVGDVLIAVLERRFTFQAGISSIAKIFLNVFNDYIMFIIFRF